MESGAIDVYVYIIVCGNLYLAYSYTFYYLRRKGNHEKNKKIIIFADQPQAMDFLINMK